MSGEPKPGAAGGGPRPAPAEPRAAALHHHPDRHALICEAAYLRAERRGFVPGFELEDWLAAEVEVDQRLVGEGRVF